MNPKRFWVRSRLLFVILLTCSTCLLFAQSPAGVANSDATYQALRNIGAGTESVAVENVVLKREFATFTFRSGVISFAAPVNGKITGAVFTGEGSLTFSVPSDAEKRSLSILTKSQDFSESFNQVVFRFTDNTYEELKKAGRVQNSADPQSSKALADNVERLRNDRATRYNISARVLQDLLATSPGGFFAAFINGKKYNSKEVFVVDPQGARIYGLEPEEVAFVTYDENKFGAWAVSHLEREVTAGTAKGSELNGPIDVQSQKLEVDIQKSGELHGTATTTFVAARDGIRVAPFTLFRHFKVDSVTDEAGQPLPFIFEQVTFNRNEGDDEDNFSVILQKALAKGEKFTIKTVYGGKDAVRNEGSGNYYPVARLDWFPFTRTGDYAEYDMTLRIPKGMKMAATGTLVSEKTEGDWHVTQWKTDAPIAVAGFSFGRFKLLEQKLNNGFVIQSYANESQPDWVQALQRAAEGDDAVSMHNGMGQAPDVALGTMSTTTMMKKPLAEAQMAMALYSDYFGETPFKRLAMTQQTACDYGQSWPGLVYLPICSFFDSTVRHQLGVDDTGVPYWNVVAPHEVAHQWWGQTVGWASYRDQWISEGFAQESASIFMQYFYKKDPGMYQRFWKLHQEYLQQKDQFGFRPIDVGPVTMGYRVSTFRTGANTDTNIIYGKGGFILHMIHYMMWDPKVGDQNFKAMMRDFVKTYGNRPASTEDFKATVEKFMTPQMDLDGNRKMDWFFNQYVYGTELPKYEFTYNIVNDANGPVVDLKLTQSNVSPKFKMLVPLYAELQDGRIARLGSASLTGNNTLQQKIPLGNVTAKRFMINYNFDVLSGM